MAEQTRRLHVYPAWNQLGTIKASAGALAGYHPPKYDCAAPDTPAVEMTR